MAYPEPYSRQYDYASYQNANPTRPLPGVRVNVDLDEVERAGGGVALEHHQLRVVLVADHVDVFAVGAHRHGAGLGKPPVPSRTTRR